MADVPLPPGFQPGRLGDKVERALVRFLLRVYNATIGNLIEAVRDAWDQWLERAEQYLVSLYAPWLGRILETPDLPPELRSMIQELRSPSSQFGALVATTAAGATVGGSCDPAFPIHQPCCASSGAGGSNPASTC